MENKHVEVVRRVIVIGCAVALVSMPIESRGQPSILRPVDKDVPFDFRTVPEAARVAS